MRYRKTSYYTKDIYQVGPAIQKVFEQQGYKLIEKDTDKQSMLFQLKGSFFNWKSISLIAMYRKHDKRVEVILMDKETNSHRDVETAGHEIFNLLDEMLPVNMDDI